MDIMTNFNQQLLNLDLAQPLKRGLLAISGGIDSMVLLDAVLHLSQFEGFEEIEWVVAHFDHQLRTASRQDVENIKNICDQHHLTYFIGKWDQPAQSNVEAQARSARYQFLAQVYQAVEADLLLTAHHLDDQIETVLMKMVRGSSLKGLGGIRHFTQRLVTVDNGQTIQLNILRPFLKIPRQTIEDYAQTHKVLYQHDETNFQTTYLRNRIRQRVVPHLMEENPQAYEHIHQSIHKFQMTYQAHWDNFLLEEPRYIFANKQGGWTLPLEAWLELPASTRYVYLSMLFEERIVKKMGPYSLSIIDAVLEMMEKEDQPNSMVQCTASWIARRAYDYIYILEEDVADGNNLKQALVLEKLNHWYAISETERIGIFEQNQVKDNINKGETLVLHMHLNQRLPYLEVRHRQDGDWMPLIDSRNQVFAKKISRIFIDDKIPMTERDEMRIVAGRDQCCYWLIGHRKYANPNIASQEDITHSILYEKTEKNLDKCDNIKALL